MKPANKFIVLILLCLLSGSVSAANRSAQDLLAKPRIVVASNVRVRSEPNTAATEVTKLQLGVVIRPVEQSKAREKIGNAEDFWYRLALADGKEGWVFGAFTMPYDAKDRDAIYKRIASDRLKIENPNFADAADLARFLTAAAKEITEKSALSWVELSRLLAMKQAAAAIPIDQQEQSPFKEWLKANEASLVYSEPAGSWLVRSDLFWALQKKYVALPIAGQIAWEGAQNSLPGECEGYPPCHLGRINLTVGKYLQLYPRGARADEALSQIIEELKNVAEYGALEGKAGAEDAKDARPEIVTLRATITKTTSAKKAEALQLLSRYEQFYR